MSFPLHARLGSPQHSADNNAVGVFQSIETLSAAGLDCPLWDEHDNIYQRIPVTFRVKKSAEKTCSEISIEPMPGSTHLLFLRIRMVTEAPFTKLWYPATDLLGWGSDLDYEFPNQSVAGVAIEDCQINTRTAPRELRNFRARWLSFMSVKLVVDGPDDYVQLVRFLEYLHAQTGWKLGSLRFEDVQICWIDSTTGRTDQRRSTAKQFPQANYKWESENEIKAGLRGLIDVFTRA